MSKCIDWYLKIKAPHPTLKKRRNIFITPKTIYGKYYIRCGWSNKYQELNPLKIYQKVLQYFLDALYNLLDLTNKTIKLSRVILTLRSLSLKEVAKLGRQLKCLYSVEQLLTQVTADISSSQSTADSTSSLYSTMCTTIKLV